MVEQKSSRCHLVAAVTALAAAIGLVGCAGIPSKALSARTTDANECVAWPVDKRAACFEAMPKLSDDEPENCAYYVEGTGWVMADDPSIGHRRLSNGSYSSLATHRFEYGNVRAASRGCFLEVARKDNEKATKVSADMAKRTQKAEAAKVDKERRDAEQNRQEQIRRAAAGCINLKVVYPTFEGITEADKESFRQQCKDIMNVGLMAVVELSAKDCAGRYYEKSKKEPPSCDIKLKKGLDVPVDAVQRMNDACVDKCREKIGDVSRDVAASKAELNKKPPASTPPPGTRENCQEACRQMCTSAGAGSPQSKDIAANCEKSCFPQCSQLPRAM